MVFGGGYFKDNNLINPVWINVEHCDRREKGVAPKDAFTKPGREAKEVRIALEGRAQGRSYSSL